MTTVVDGNMSADPHGEAVYGNNASHQSWRRILLLIIAITVHNIPGYAGKISVLLVAVWRKSVDGEIIFFNFYLMIFCVV